MSSSESDGSGKEREWEGLWEEGGGGRRRGRVVAWRGVADLEKRTASNLYRP